MNKIELRPIKLDKDYAEKWNEINKDFCNLYVDGKKMTDTLYRIGGMGAKLKDPYFQVLKYTEEYYDDNITTDPKRKPHLSGCWCIIDNNGVEKVTVRHFDHLYLQGGQIFSVNNKYYNIETGELYGDSCYKTMSTKNFIFIDNSYDSDQSKQGVIQVTKATGESKLIQ